MKEIFWVVYKSTYAGDYGEYTKEEPVAILKTEKEADSFIKENYDRFGPMWKWGFSQYGEI